MAEEIQQKKETVNINFPIKVALHARVKAKAALLGMEMQTYIVELLDFATQNIMAKGLGVKQEKVKNEK